MNPKKNKTNHHHRRCGMVYAVRRSSSWPNVREDTATPSNEHEHRHNGTSSSSSSTDPIPNPPFSSSSRITLRNATWATTSLWESSSHLYLPEMGPDDPPRATTGHGVVHCRRRPSSSLSLPLSSSSSSSMSSLRSLQIADLLQQALDLTAIDFSQGTMNVNGDDDDDCDSHDFHSQ